MPFPAKTPEKEGGKGKEEFLIFLLGGKLLEMKLQTENNFRMNLKMFSWVI